MEKITPKITIGECLLQNLTFTPKSVKLHSCAMLLCKGFIILGSGLVVKAEDLRPKTCGSECCHCLPVGCNLITSFDKQWPTIFVMIVQANIHV